MRRLDFSTVHDSPLFVIFLFPGVIDRHFIIRRNKYQATRRGDVSRPFFLFFFFCSFCLSTEGGGIQPDVVKF